MARARILHRLLPALLLLALRPRPTAQNNWPRRHNHPRPAPPAHMPPLCDAQYTLVNSACGSLDDARFPLGTGQFRAVNGTDEGRENCCRWLREVDNLCVCELLVPLPSFMTRPAHNYTVVVNGTCEVTFRCGSRFVGL